MEQLQHNWLALCEQENAANGSCYCTVHIILGGGEHPAWSPKVAIYYLYIYIYIYVWGLEMLAFVLDALYLTADFCKKCDNKANVLAEWTL